MRRVVVLPEPDGPSIAKNSPSATSRLTRSTATTSPYVFRTPRRLTAAAPDGSGCCCSKRLLEPVEARIEVLVGRGDRHQDADHVVVDPGLQDDEPPVERRRDRRRCDVGPGLARLTVLHELDG